MTDLVTWLNTTATLLVAQLPLQSQDDSLVLAEAYLSDVGGWIPDDPLQPNGNGAPGNAFTEQQAADAITENEFNTIYDLNLTVDVTLNLQTVARLSAGLTLNDAATSMINQVVDFITNGINNSKLPLRVDSIATQTPVSGNSNFSNFNPATKESTTQAIRLLIQTEIAGPDKIVDFKASTLLYVRNTYGLDDTWNVTSVYTRVNEPITVQVEKYEDNSYVTLDSGSDLIYVITISPTTYVIVSGVILNKS